MPFALTDPVARNLTLAVCVLVFGADALVGQRARRGDDRVEDRGTVIAIYTLQLAALALAVLFAYRAPATAVPGDPWIPVIVGVVLMVGGMAFRVSAILTLGPLFTRQVMVRRGHRVVADGPYRWLRHPSYSGALLTFLGIGVLLGNWLSVAVLLLLPFAAYAWRIRVEEAVLEANFGSEYAAYARGRPRLIPWLW